MRCRLTKLGPPADSSYFPVAIAADPANHLAAAMNTPFSENSDTFQLASFTINNTTGAIQSTDTYANMPTLQVYPTSMDMSWDGMLLAVGGCSGLELFHFNGANPPTAFGPPLPINVCFDHVAWDKSNHLYAIGGCRNGAPHVPVMHPSYIELESRSSSIT
jgi:hypothetical protein